MKRQELERSCIRIGPLESAHSDGIGDGIEEWKDAQVSWANRALISIPKWVRNPPSAGHALAKWGAALRRRRNLVLVAANLLGCSLV